MRFMMWRQVALCLILSAAPAFAAGHSRLPGELNDGSPAAAAARIAASGLSLQPQPVVWPVMLGGGAIGFCGDESGLCGPGGVLCGLPVFALPGAGGRRVFHFHR
jgi:hypothetical protein